MFDLPFAHRLPGRTTHAGAQQWNELLKDFWRNWMGSAGSGTALLFRRFTTVYQLSRSQRDDWAG
jgi:hypothetical protein